MFFVHWLKEVRILPPTCSWHIYDFSADVDVLFLNAIILHQPNDRGVTIANPIESSDCSSQKEMLWQNCAACKGINKSRIKTRRQNNLPSEHGWLKVGSLARDVGSLAFWLSFGVSFPGHLCPKNLFGFVGFSSDFFGPNAVKMLG